VSTDWMDYGLQLSQTGGYLKPRLFDTANPGTQRLGDPDLGSPNEKCTPSGPGVGVGGEPGMPGENCVPQGNVLIIQESNTEVPDDNVDGGTIIFNFVIKAETVYEIGLMDVDYETDIEVTYHDENGKKQTATIEVPLAGDNSVQVLAINYDNVSQLKLNLSRSGAVTFITFCTPSAPSGPPVATPTSLPSRTPTVASPTKFATEAPTVAPTVAPEPTELPLPSRSPVVSSPTKVTAPVPSRSPVVSSPTKVTAPSAVPTRAPVTEPTAPEPTEGAATPVPTQFPSRSPIYSKPTKSLVPSEVPTRTPDVEPTDTPPAETLSPTASSVCSETIIDFDALPDGTPLAGGEYLGTEWLEEYGLTLSASGGFSDKPRLFDTANPGDEKIGDIDLGSPNEKCAGGGPGVGVGGEPGEPGENCVPQGNVLIIQESDTRQPDDNVDGGTITFDFSSEVDVVNEIGLMDIDYAGTIEVDYLDSKGNASTKTFELALFGDNALQVVEIGVERVTQIRFNLTRSGAVTYLSFCSKSFTERKRLLAEATAEESGVQLAAGKCKASGFESPIKILSQDMETVTFSVSQVWKGCDDSKLGWIATDYFGKGGELTCAKTDSLECGLAATYTAQCKDGSSVVDIFVYDDSFVFGQTDGSEVELPTACGASGDVSKMCHFRYLLNCGSVEEMIQAQVRKVERGSEKKQKRFWLL